MRKTLLLQLMLVAGISLSPLVLAHHSYADYEIKQRFVFTGVVTSVRWENPHILFDVSDGTEVMRIEWITIAGADKTGVAESQIQAGDQLTIIGSRNRNPDVHTMTVIKELVMPAKDWQWISPSELRSRQ